LPEGGSFAEIFRTMFAIPAYSFRTSWDMIENLPCVSHSLEQER
jgi:hypothetical protein